MSGNFEDLFLHWGLQMRHYSLDHLDSLMQLGNVPFLVSRNILDCLMMNFAELLKSFGKSIGFDDLRQDEDGICYLGIADYIVNIKPIDDERKLLLFAKITDFPQEIELRVLRALLKGNYLFIASQQATLSINPKGDKIFLQQIESVADLDGERLAEVVERFTNQIQMWQTLIQEAEQTIPADAQENRQEDLSFNQPFKNDMSTVGDADGQFMIKI